MSKTREALEAAKAEIEEIKATFNYVAETGNIFWRKPANNKRKKNNLAGCLQADGRVRIKFKGKNYYAYRIAWLLSQGRWPTGQIDHIDGNPSNNRLSNLRDVSKSVNQQNRKHCNTTNQSKLLGVSSHKQTGKFQAEIKICGASKYLGLFATPQEAHAAYLKEKRNLHEGCTI